MNHKDKRQIQTNENRERLDKTRQDKMASQEKTEGPDKDLRENKDTRTVDEVQLERGGKRTGEGRN